VGYVHHLVGHRTALGWAAHQPHHTGPRFELSLALRQSWLPVHGVLILPIVAVGGWGPLTLVGCAAVSRLLQALQHTSAEWPVPDSVRAVVMTPRQHRVHHATGAAVNLGPVLTCWDRLARTYHPGTAGARPEPAPALASGDHPVRHQLAGWRALLPG
jgi:sterol desaturase/sphingolipid hydroxylase (fatty acid hydroxylase superfamily)